MPIKRIAKILGFVFLPLIPMAVVMYFLFPYINAEKHNKIARKYDDEVVIGDTTKGATIGEDFVSVTERAKVFQQNIQELRVDIDSLKMVNDSLKKALAAKESEIKKFESNQGADAENAALVAQNTETTDAEFSENIKSLLDLDVERLTPILSNMSDKQLVRIFQAGSGLQRKKLLRSLESERAAKLMKEVL